jgi:hypothetical protein
VKQSLQKVPSFKKTNSIIYLRHYHACPNKGCFVVLLPASPYILAKNSEVYSHLKPFLASFIVSLPKIICVLSGKRLTIEAFSINGCIPETGGGIFVLGKVVTVQTLDRWEVHLALFTMPGPNGRNYFSVKSIGMRHVIVAHRLTAEFTADRATTVPKLFTAHLRPYGVVTSGDFI